MKPDNDKPNCYQCIHRRGLMGDAHSKCAHPDMHEEDTASAAKKLGIVGNPHGIKNGWFFWPFNFDPAWLKACNGFTSKDQNTGGSDEG